MKKVTKRRAAQAEEPPDDWDKIADKLDQFVLENSPPDDPPPKKPIFEADSFAELADMLRWYLDYHTSDPTDDTERVLGSVLTQAEAQARQLRRKHSDDLEKLPPWAFRKDAKPSESLHALWELCQESAAKSQPGSGPTVPDTSDSTSKAKRKRTPKGELPTWVKYALFTVEAHPGWKDAQIADDVGVNRSTVHRHKVFQRMAGKIRKMNPSDFPSGFATTDANGFDGVGTSDVTGVTPAPDPDEVKKLDAKLDAEMAQRNTQRNTSARKKAKNSGKYRP